MKGGPTAGEEVYLLEVAEAFVIEKGILLDLVDVGESVVMCGRNLGYVRLWLLLLLEKRRGWLLGGWSWGWRDMQYYFRWRFAGGGDIGLGRGEWSGRSGVEGECGRQQGTLERVLALGGGGRGGVEYGVEFVEGDVGGTIWRMGVLEKGH